MSLDVQPLERAALSGIRGGIDKHPTETPVHHDSIWYRGVEGSPRLGPHDAERCPPLVRAMTKVPVSMHAIQTEKWISVFFCLK